MSPQHECHPSGAAVGQLPAMTASSHRSSAFAVDRPCFAREGWGGGKDHDWKGIRVRGFFCRYVRQVVIQPGPRVHVAAVKVPRKLVSGGWMELGPRMNNLKRFRTHTCILKELGPG